MPKNNPLISLITETELFASLTESFNESKKAEIALPRFAKVEEVAVAAVFLASDPDGKAFTRQTLSPNSRDVMF